MQGLQDLLAPGKVRIALQGHMPVGSKRGQTGLQELTGFWLIQVQVPGQFKDHRFARRQKITPFPPDDRQTMRPKGFSKLLLREVPALAKRFEQRSKRTKLVVGLSHLPIRWGRYRRRHRTPFLSLKQRTVHVGNCLTSCLYRRLADLDFTWKGTSGRVHIWLEEITKRLIGGTRARGESGCSSPR
jgi:hypothetical protein